MNSAGGRKIVSLDAMSACPSRFPILVLLIENTELILRPVYQDSQVIALYSELHANGIFLDILKK
jgi:hypothetical protein